MIHVGRKAIKVISESDCLELSDASRALQIKYFTPDVSDQPHRIFASVYEADVGYLSGEISLGQLKDAIKAAVSKEPDMKAFHAAQSEWSQETFGTDAERGPIGPLKHMARELLTELLGIPRETVTALLDTVGDKPATDDVFEYADLQFLLFDASRRAKIGYDRLLGACNAKLVVNKARKWGPKSGNEAVEHIREAGA